MKVELTQEDMNYLRVLFKCVQDATDPTAVATKSAVFVDKQIVKDMEMVFLTLGRIGTVTKLCGGSHD